MSTPLRLRLGPRVRTSDGVEIATYDLGGRGPPLLLCHATGFHGPAWLPVAERLGGRFHCLAFDARGHGLSAKAPGDDYAWAGFGRDVLAVVDGLALERPRAAGHSCGGAMLLLAEEARPDTFRSLYCYEPVLTPDDTDTGPAQGDAMADQARRRREVFPSLEAAEANYRAKPPFDAFDPAAVRAYVTYGFEDRGDDGFRLRCRREDEARVYLMAHRHSAFARLARVSCPVTLVCGATEPHFGAEVMAAVASRLPRATTEVMAGAGHFGPMERPDQVALSMMTAFHAMDGPDPGAGDAVRFPVTPPS